MAKDLHLFRATVYLFLQIKFIKIGLNMYNYRGIYNIDKTINLQSKQNL
jgi:hypothetical protein